MRREPQGCLPSFLRFLFAQPQAAPPAKLPPKVMVSNRFLSEAEKHFLRALRTVAANRPLRC